MSEMNDYAHEEMIKNIKRKALLELHFWGKKDIFSIWGHFSPSSKVIFWILFSMGNNFRRNYEGSFFCTQLDVFVSLLNYIMLVFLSVSWHPQEVSSRNNTAYELHCYTHDINSEHL